MALGPGYRNSGGIASPLRPCAGLRILPFTWETLLTNSCHRNLAVLKPILQARVERVSQEYSGRQILKPCRAGKVVESGLYDLVWFWRSF